MDCIYVLELQNGKYFIGRSMDPVISIKQHEDANSDSVHSGWINQYLPIVHYSVHLYDENFSVDKCVRLYMLMYGYSQARGGSYEEKLTEDQILSLNAENKHRDNVLRFVSTMCNRCGSYEHETEDCYFGVDAEGNPVEDFRETHLSQAERFKYTIECARCGRQSHIVSKCTQIRDEDGKCLRCGIGGHGSNTCNAIMDKDGNCTKCGESSHNSNNCTATKHIRGYSLVKSSCVLL